MSKTNGSLVQNPEYGQGMELVSISLTGYRRFVKEARLQTNGKIIAILGPNEAGKTSILRALTQSLSQAAIPAEDTSRDIDRDLTQIVSKYLLTVEEAKNADLPWPSWLTVHRRATGKLRYGILPHFPRRNIDHRPKLQRKFEALAKQDVILEALNDFDEDAQSWLDTSITILGSNQETLTAAEIEQLSKLRSFLSDKNARTLKGIATVSADLDAAIKQEEEPTPFSKAISVLTPRLPAIILFGEEDRLLKSSYNTSEYRERPPKALQGLCDISGLKLDKVLEAIDDDQEPKLHTLEHRANENLKNKFTNSWNQSNIHVSFRITKEAIGIHVVDEDQVFTSISERSDGLRQFVALQSFLSNTDVKNPILLIDEAEQRLHYDAQADLIQMLSKQDASPKIILTTHSAGCLPEDLGNGVRLATFAEKPTQSNIKNKFWDSKETGFAPLLFGMGASTLAFFPTRNAVIVEGASDMLLLPTMFKEALETSSLGFQFVPGLANGPASLAPLTSENHEGISYLLDGDASGDIIKAALEKNIPKSRIFQMLSRDKSSIELEDFLHIDLFFDAVDDILVKIHGKRPLNRSKISNRERTKSLGKIYKSITGEALPKVGIAYYILDRIQENPSLKILDTKRRRAFASVASKVLKSFSLRSPAQSSPATA